MIIVGDIHWSEYSSIVRQQGIKYSKRLENLIESINWVNEQAKNGETIIQLGDFFDRSDIRGNELTALKEVDISKWIAIQGNHELDVNGSSIDCAKIAKIVKVPTISKERFVNIVYLPYILEKDRKPLKEYIEGLDRTFPTIILSHNDIKGIRYGAYVSKIGFSIEEIESNCDLFLNGHLHNREMVSEKIINVGNLTGQNFNEDYTKYKHGIVKVDVENIGKGKPNSCMTFIENPHAMKFNSIEISSKSDLDQLGERVDDRTVLCITTNEGMREDCIKFVNAELMCGRVITRYDKCETENTQEIKTVNHIEKFKNCVFEKFGNVSGILDEI